MRIYQVKKEDQLGRDLKTANTFARKISTPSVYIVPDEQLHRRPRGELDCERCGVGGACSGSVVSFHLSGGGVLSGSSRMPASYEMWKRFSSVDHALAVVGGRGLSWSR